MSCYTCDAGAALSSCRCRAATRSTTSWRGRHRDERAKYHQALRIVDQHHIPVLHPGEDYRWPAPELPPDEETLLEMLERELGAHPIPA